MKRGPAVVLILAAAAVAACGGYWVGFRHAWDMGLRADAAPRGAIAVSQLRFLEQGRLNDVRVGLEHDIDMGLIHWHELLASPASPLLNVLSGEDVMPEYERYVRRLAMYRKGHRSSLNDAAQVQSLIDRAGKVSPSAAADMKQGNEQVVKTLDEMVRKYAP